MFTEVKSVTKISLQENGLSAMYITVTEEMVNSLAPMIQFFEGQVPKMVGKLHDGTVVELKNVTASIVTNEVIKLEFLQDEMIVLENFDLETFKASLEEEENFDDDFDFEDDFEDDFRF